MRTPQQFLEGFSRHSALVLLAAARGCLGGL